MRRPSSKELLLASTLAAAVGADHYGRGRADSPPIAASAPSASEPAPKPPEVCGVPAPSAEPDSEPRLASVLPPPSFERPKNPSEILMEKIRLLKQLVSWAVPIDDVQSPGAAKPSITQRQAADQEILTLTRDALEFTSANKLTTDDWIVAEWRGVAINAHLNQFHLTGAEIEAALRRWDRRNKK
ncbi:MAG: hypothetical protein Q7K39_01685 [Candidatus Magasanikbacteria bacterium]|nr:hypothetical protein [Candidatus Magasanikbacteria bacterium]